MQKRDDGLSFCVISRIRCRRKRSRSERRTATGRPQKVAVTRGDMDLWCNRNIDWSWSIFRSELHGCVRRAIDFSSEHRAPCTCDGFIALREIIRSSKEAMTAVASCHGFSFRCIKRRSPEPCSMEHISQRHSADAPNSCTRHIDASALRINIHTLLCVIDTVAARMTSIFMSPGFGSLPFFSAAKETEYVESSHRNRRYLCAQR